MGANNHDERMAKMLFATVYPLYLTKIEKKGRTEAELQEVIEWLTGFNKKKMQEQIDKRVYHSNFILRKRMVYPGGISVKFFRKSISKWYNIREILRECKIESECSLDYGNDLWLSN